MGRYLKASPRITGKEPQSKGPLSLWRRRITFSTRLVFDAIVDGMSEQPKRELAEDSPAPGVALRQRLFESGAELFRSEGFASTTIRSIANRAGVGLDTAVQYFPTRSHVVLYGYRAAASDWESSVSEIECHTLGRRFEATVEGKWRLLQDDRRLFREIFSEMTGDSPLGVRSVDNAAVRTQGIAVIGFAVRGSTAALRLTEDNLARLTRLLYALIRQNRRQLQPIRRCLVDAVARSSRIER